LIRENDHGMQDGEGQPLLQLHIRTLQQEEKVLRMSPLSQAEGSASGMFF